MAEAPPHADARPDPTPLAEQFDDLGQQHESATLGMWIFLATEVLFFGAMLLGYTVYRNAYFHDFQTASHHLYLSIGTINTAILLTSSLMMALAVHAGHSQEWKRARRYLLLTIGLGLCFLILKAVEYTLDYHEALVPAIRFDQAKMAPADPQHAALFLAFYWIMTGIHAAHVLSGISIMTVLLLAISLGREPARYQNAIENTGLFWHLVDIIWVFLFPLLYLLGAS